MKSVDSQLSSGAKKYCPWGPQGPMGRGFDITAIAFASRRLKEHEKKYSISEKEFLAILWGLEHFKYFVYGTPVDVITDHKALEQ